MFVFTFENNRFYNLSMLFQKERKLKEKEENREK